MQEEDDTWHDASVNELLGHVGMDPYTANPWDVGVYIKNAPKGKGKGGKGKGEHVGIAAKQAIFPRVP